MSLASCTKSRDEGSREGDTVAVCEDETENRVIIFRTSAVSTIYKILGIPIASGNDVQAAKTTQTAGEVAPDQGGKGAEEGEGVEGEGREGVEERACLHTREKRGIRCR